MIISKIEYGLGNQLFQYAFARRLAIERNDLLLIDKSWYEEFDESTGMTQRDFLLDQFNISLAYSNQREKRMNSFNRIMLHQLRKYHHRLYLTITGKFEALPFFISGLDAVHEARKIGRDIQVMGMWTDYRFYEPVRATLLHELRPRNEANEIGKKLLNEIRVGTSVFVHIRRGDYLKKRMHDLGGVCNLEYYNRGIAEIMARCDRPIFYFFSDDMKWVKENFSALPNSVFVEHNDANPVEDFRLMQNCKHAIMSNSTFSWWAAWLIENESKCVVAPDVWNKTKRESTNTLIPATWIRIAGLK